MSGSNSISNTRNLSSVIQTVRETVKCDFEKYDSAYFKQQITWKYHISIVVKYAKRLAVKLGEDVQIAELVALLHDIGRARCGNVDHHITGAREAGKILTGLDVPSQIIKVIQDSILSHSGTGDCPPPNSKMAEILMSADVMAHFDTLPVFVQVALANGNDTKKAFRWLCKKVDIDWNNKLTLKCAREMTKDKYTAIKLLLDTMAEYV